MLDIKFIRENPDAVRENIKKKFQDAKLPLVDEVLDLDSKRRAAIAEADQLRSNRNTLSKQIGMLMGQAKKDPSKLAEAEAAKAQVKANADRLSQLEQLEDELAHGRVDLVIAFHPIMLEGVETVPLTEDRLIMVVPKVFTDQVFGPRAEEMRAQYAQGADITAFRQMPFILLKRGNRVRGIVDQYLSRCYFKPKIILETENTVTTLAMAREGMGIVICPQLFLRTIHLPGVKPAPEDVDLFPLADPSTLSRLVVGYRRDRYLSHFAERFILIAQDVLRK